MCRHMLTRVKPLAAAGWPRCRMLADPDRAIRPPIHVTTRDAVVEPMASPHLNEVLDRVRELRAARPASAADAAGRQGATGRGGVGVRRAGRCRSCDRLRVGRSTA